MKTRREDGLSLVETILALGLLATVLISVAGMFVLSDRQVKSGRTASEALAVAQTVVEEMNSWGFHQTYQMFGYDGTAKTYSVDTRSSSYGDHWQASLEESLASPYAIIDITSLHSGSPAPDLNSTRTIRVVVTIHWKEGIRPRKVQVASVRT